jgi:glycogen phosphorylase
VGAADFLELLPGTVEVSIEGRLVLVRAWKRELVGPDGHTVPILLLDADVEGNTSGDRSLTDWLYGGDERYRLAQEIILGVGGLRILPEVGYRNIRLIHLNEEHAAFAALELLRIQRNLGGWGFGAVQRRCIFTTHTPVAAGHEQFDWPLVRTVLGEPVPHDVLAMLGGAERLNMTMLALNLSHFVNGVARKHGEVAERMFPGHHIKYITNGVHSTTWTSRGFQELFDKYVPAWRDDPSMLRKAVGIPEQAIWDAHVRAKAALIDVVRKRTG